MISGQWIMIKGFNCWVTLDYLSIKDSYQMRYEDIESFCDELRRRAPFSYLRSKESWAEEIAAHNALYNLHLFRSRTKDAEIDEDESVVRLIGYKFIAWLYKIYRKIRYK